MTRQPHVDQKIPVELKEADEAMHHYGQWAKARFKIGACGSIERKYRSPQHWDPPEPAVVLIAGWRAFELQQIVQTLPLTHRMVLWAQYDADDHGFAQRYCTRHGIRSRAQWFKFQVDGLRMLVNRLRALRMAGESA